MNIDMNVSNLHAKDRAVILLSGGLDSTVTLAEAKAQNFDCWVLSINYRQRSQMELAAATKIVKALQVLHHLKLNINLRKIGGSSLTSKMPVPKNRSFSEIRKGIPNTYVPARNMIFLALALSYAESISSLDIFIGITARDRFGYPDCSQEFIRRFEALAKIATTIPRRKRLRIHTPLIGLTKAEIIRRGVQLGIDFSLTSSCFDPSPKGLACGACDSCRLRLRGFRDAGLIDPIRYR